MLADRVRTAFAVLNELPAVNAKIAAGIIFAAGLMLVYLALLLTGRDGRINLEAFGIACSFVLAFAGIAAWTYGKKRDTYAAPSPDSDRANVPSGPPKEVQ